MKISASIKSSFSRHQVWVQSADAAKEMQIGYKDSGFGSAINGGELLLLSLATCFCNDLYREAAKKRIVINGVELDFSAEFGAEGEPGTDFTYTARVDSAADPAVIRELLQYTDQVAEIHATLRKGVHIRLSLAGS